MFLYLDRMVSGREARRIQQALERAGVSFQCATADGVTYAAAGAVVDLEEPSTEHDPRRGAEVGRLKRWVATLTATVLRRRTRLVVQAPWYEFARLVGRGVLPTFPGAHVLDVARTLREAVFRAAETSDGLELVHKVLAAWRTARIAAEEIPPAHPRRRSEMITYCATLLERLDDWADNYLLRHLGGAQREAPLGRGPYRLSWTYALDVRKDKVVVEPQDSTGSPLEAARVCGACSNLAAKLVGRFMFCVLRGDLREVFELVSQLAARGGSPTRETREMLARMYRAAPVVPAQRLAAEVERCSASGGLSWTSGNVPGADVLWLGPYPLGVLRRLPGGACRVLEHRNGTVEVAPLGASSERVRAWAVGRVQLRCSAVGKPTRPVMKERT